MSEWMLTNEAAQALEVSPETVRVFHRTGLLPATRTAGGVRLFRRSDVEALARERAKTRARNPGGDDSAAAIG